jgi:hypothetical protein
MTIEELEQLVRSDTPEIVLSSKEDINLFADLCIKICWHNEPPASLENYKKMRTATKITAKKTESPEDPCMYKASFEREWYFEFEKVSP